MKLSEAILLGSVGSEQGFEYETGTPISSKKCALGAALLAVNRQTENPCHIIMQQWPWTAELVTLPVVMPIYSKGLIDMTVVNAIWMLNDKARWTRPQIAAWVASIEPVEPTDLLMPTSHEQEVAVNT
jgi:hypothetical protein